MKNYLIFFIILFIASNCSRNKNPLSPAASSEFSIFLLKDSDITYEQASKYALDKLEIQDEPWLCLDDIFMYDFSTHYIYVNDDKERFFKDITGEGHIFGEFLIKPFLLIARQERIYLGSFISSLSSIMCAGPNIGDVEQLFYPSDVIPINGCDVDEWTDVRNDKRIQNALIKNNLYHAGLDIKLIMVAIIENSDTSTITYSFTITNNDQDDLLIPDPDLMGSELFHYYTNGIDFWSIDSHYYYSQYKTTISPNPYNGWDPSWFLELKSKESIDRTVCLKGYPKFPIGNYDCYFNYSGPQKIDRSVRIDQNRRYWMGNIKSNMITIFVNYMN